MYVTFSLFLYKGFMKLIKFDIFLCECAYKLILYSRMFMYLLETANIMFLSFIRFELLSFEHGNPISHKM